MPIIPMKQTVTIVPAGGLDDWGAPIGATPYTLKCRISEGNKVTVDNTSSNDLNGVSARESVATAQIFFDKLVNIDSNDKLTFTDELGVTHTYKPINIQKKRGFNGKAMLTVVDVK